MTLYQVLNSEGAVTHSWLSTDKGADYYEPSFGDPGTYTVSATDITGTKLDPRMVALRSQRDALMLSTKWVQERHLDEKALGVPTTLSADTYQSWLYYWQALRALPDSSPDLDNVSWPSQPPTKG